jgi:plasmid stabilization system protein ParE
MRHNVELSRRAQRDIAEAHEYIRQDAPGRAERWRQRLLAAIDTLEHWPARHSLAPEAETVGMDLRQMLFGAYRILYVVEGDIVNVLTVRHGARRSLEPDELGGMQ